MAAALKNGCLSFVSVLLAHFSYILVCAYVHIHTFVCVIFEFAYVTKEN